MSITLSTSNPVDGSDSNSERSSFYCKFTIDPPTVGTFPTDKSGIKIVLNLGDGNPPEVVFENGALKDNYTGNVSVADSDSTHPATILSVSFTRSQPLLFNRDQSVLITGTLVGGIPFFDTFTLPYHFKTGNLTSIRPSSVTPIIPPGTIPPPKNTPANSVISFGIAPNVGSVIDKNSINVTLKVNSSPFYVITSGIPVAPPYPYSATIDPTTTTSSRGYTVSILPITSDFPYSTSSPLLDSIVEVDVDGTELVGAVLDPHTFSQNFNFQIVPEPVSLSSLDKESVIDIGDYFSSLNTDGAAYYRSYSDSDVIVAGVNTLWDTTSSHFSDADVGRSIQIVDALNPANGRDTKITSYKDVLVSLVPPVPAHSEIIIDTKGVDLTFTSYPASLPVDSVTVYVPLVLQSGGSSGASAQDLAKSSTNGIFLAVQDWVRSLGAFKKTFRSLDFISPTGSDWKLPDPASSIQDPVNTSLSVISFPKVSSGVKGEGFLLRIPSGTNGLKFSAIGRARTAPGVISTVGWTLWYREVPDNSVMPSVGTGWHSEIMPDFSVTTDVFYHYYGNQEILLSDFIPVLKQGSLYQFQLSRSVPAIGSVELNQDFFLLEYSIEFG